MVASTLWVTSRPMKPIAMRRWQTKRNTVGCGTNGWSPTHRRKVRQQLVAPTAGAVHVHRSMRAVMVVGLACTLTVAAACGNNKDDKVDSAPKPNAENAADAESVTAALNAGLQAHVEGRTSEAVTRYQEVLKLDPRNKFAIYNIGLISQNAGNNADAEAKYREVLAIDPNYQPALFNLAIVRTAAGDTREAIALYRRAIAADPNDASAHLNLGLLLRRTGSKAEGDAEVKKALELNPKLTDPASK